MLRGKTIIILWEKGANKDYMQPAEFVIDCNLKKVISCTYSDGGLGRMNAGDVVGLLSGIQDRKR